MPYVNSFENHFSNPQMGSASDVYTVEVPYGPGWGAPFPIAHIVARISGAARDAGNTGYTTTLRPYLIMGRVTSTGLLKQWAPDATDGSQKVFGILMSALNTQASGADQDKLWTVIVGGSVPARALAIAASATQGLVGNAQEFNLRAQMSPQFWFDDDPGMFLSGRNKGAPLVLTATETLTTAMQGQDLVVAGSGAVTLTLPALKAGLRYRIYNAVDQNLIVAAGDADTLIILNDIAADSVALSTSSEKIGGSFEFICDGTKWYVIPSLWEAQTVTVVT